MVNLLCQHMDWQSGILVADWDLRKAFEREYIPWLHQSTYYWKPVCQGGITLGLHFFIFEAVSG